MISGLDHGNRNDIYPSWTESVITYIIHDRKNKEEQRNLNWVTYWAKQIERLFRDQFFSQFFDCVITYIIIWNLSRMTNGYESRGESQFIDDYGVMFFLGSLSSYWNDTYKLSKVIPTSRRYKWYLHSIYPTQTPSLGHNNSMLKLDSHAVPYRVCTYVCTYRGSGVGPTHWGYTLYH
jgi:hypothetical protein